MAYKYISSWANLSPINQQQASIIQCIQTSIAAIHTILVGIITCDINTSVSDSVYVEYQYNAHL